VEKIFVDSDIVLDLLTGRAPHHLSAAALFSLAEKGKVSIYVSSLTFANVHYVLSRQLNNEKARNILATFKTLVTVLPVDDIIVERALSSEFKDFEDALQYHTALENRLNILLTRNLKDYKKAQIQVFTAQQYLKIRL
jgi:predicted nucleic acid-binding protein